MAFFVESGLSKACGYLCGCLLFWCCDKVVLLFGGDRGFARQVILRLVDGPGMCYLAGFLIFLPLSRFSFLLSNFDLKELVDVTMNITKKKGNLFCSRCIGRFEFDL